MNSLDLLGFLETKLEEAGDYLDQEAEGSSGQLQELARIELIEELLDLIKYSEEADV